MGKLTGRMQRAKALEARMQSEGRHADAEIVKCLRLSASVAQVTLQQLHRDNMALRQRLGLPSFSDQSTDGDDQQ